MGQDAAKSVLCLFPENEISELENFRRKYIINPGKDVPFHVTLLDSFLLPGEIDDSVVEKLKRIARKTSKFEFWAKPLSSFPSSSVLYLSPSPVTSIEKLTGELYKEFPAFDKNKYGFPIYHMTIALGNPDKERNKIVDEYFEKFGKIPLRLKAGCLGIYNTMRKYVE